MRAANPAMKVLVAQIIPVDPSSCAECAARTVDTDTDTYDGAPSVPLTTR
ncbi:hypothetical protein ACIREO_14595 [Streptomyces sp. NPDC102441]